MRQDCVEYIGCSDDLWALGGPGIDNSEFSTDHQRKPMLTVGVCQMKLRLYTNLFKKHVVFTRMLTSYMHATWTLSFFRC